MLISIFAKSFMSNNNKTNFSSFVPKVSYEQFVGLFGENVQGVLLPLIFFEGVYNSSHQPSEFPEGKLL